MPVDKIDEEWTWGIGPDNYREYEWTVELPCLLANYEVGYSKWKWAEETQKIGTFNQLLDAGQVDVWKVSDDGASVLPEGAIRAYRKDQGLMIELTDPTTLAELRTASPYSLKMKMVNSVAGEDISTTVPVEYQNQVGPTPTPTSDTTPPQLVTLGISPAQVNVTSASAMVTITARITDNLAGNAGEGYSSSPSQIRFKSPSGNQSVTAMLAGYNRVSGTALDGNYSYQMTVPQYAESGVWTIDYVLLVDQIGNSKNESAGNLAALSLPTSFVVEGAMDTTPPQLVTLGISPAQVNVTSASAMVTITARITDNLAGNAGEGYSSSPSQIRFKSPSGNQSVTAMLAGYNRVSGTALDGNYSYQMTVPQYAESGVWTIDYVLLVDQIGNSKNESAGNLAALSLPTSFVVTGPTPTPTPTQIAPPPAPSGGGGGGGAPAPSGGGGPAQVQKSKKGGGKSSAKKSSSGSSKKSTASKSSGGKKSGGKKKKKK